MPDPIVGMYQPTSDEASRQQFVGALKVLANGYVEGLLNQNYTREYEAEYEAKHGHKPQTRDEAVAALSDKDLYKLWGSLVYTSQDLLWESVGETVDRQRERFEAAAQALTSGGKTLGTLQLNPDLKIPEPIASREIHRQPGGYFYEADSEDLTSPLLYFSSVELYRTAKGLSSGTGDGEPGMGRFLVNGYKNKFGDKTPKRILDLGCAVGTETMALREAFPDAEIHGADLSGPFVRFAHIWAESNGVSAHYRQADAQATGYPDGYFDLVVSHIMFHETGPDILPNIMTEIDRILAPGGAFISGDVPYQPTQIPLYRQALNGWQVDYNGEPFWNGFADTDVKASMVDAGFTKDNVFADYVPLGQGNYYLFGAQKSA